MQQITLQYNAHSFTLRIRDGIMLVVQRNTEIELEGVKARMKINATQFVCVINLVPADVATLAIDVI